MSGSGGLAHPSPPHHASANGEQNDDEHDADSHIVELSNIIDREIRGNTWESQSSQAKTIFRVPDKEKLHAGGGESTYRPSFVSIGPYHFNATEEMRRNEQGKLWSLDRRIPHGGERSVLEYTRAVESMEAMARSCYEGDVDMDRSAFCRMLLLDAFHLITLLEMFDYAAYAAEEGGGGGGGASSPSAAAHGEGCGGGGMTTRDTVMTFHDIMMLENQIPFFVVEKVYRLHYGEGNGNTLVRELAWAAIAGILEVPSSVPDDDRRKLEFQHLVHVCHVYLKPTCLSVPGEAGKKKKHKREEGKYGRFQRATEYYEAGVTFRRWCSDDAATAGGRGGGSVAAANRRRPVLDVAFSNGVLWVALQDIHENTGYLLRNVLAYEQKYYGTATSGRSSYVTAHVLFMSQLLRGPEDVALLCRRGVVEHLLGDDGEVCALFRGLADGLAFDPAGEHYLGDVEAALQAHCRHRRHRWRAWILRHRFGNPWLVAAWLFGASAVLCTIVQTVFTVLSYLQQPH